MLPHVEDRVATSILRLFVINQLVESFLHLEIQCDDLLTVPGGRALVRVCTSMTVFWHAVTLRNVAAAHTTRVLGRTPQ